MHVTRKQRYFEYRTITFFGPAFQRIFLYLASLVSQKRVENTYILQRALRNGPHLSHPTLSCLAAVDCRALHVRRLGFSPFVRHY